MNVGLIAHDSKKKLIEESSARIHFMPQEPPED